MPSAPVGPNAGRAGAFLARVVCGIDSSPEALEAASQAAMVSAEDAELWGVAVWDPGLAMHAGIHAGSVSREAREEQTEALLTAERAVPRLKPVLKRGRYVAGLLDAIAKAEADLVSVGSHGTSRAAGVLLGSMATAMTHHAPCSVLIARTNEEQAFPATILHCGDGSDDSLAAARIAAAIARRHHSRLVTLLVGREGGSEVEDAMKVLREGGSEPESMVVAGSAHDRILELAEGLGASLVVLGSRGVTGLKALGSVSERVAHRAPCSVLIARHASHVSDDDPAG